MLLVPLLCAQAAVDAIADNWISFAPPLKDGFTQESAIDLRRLNESFAGENGAIVARDGQFVQSKTGKPIRFWAVNASFEHVEGPAALRREARILAKYGVNLVRIHGAVFDESGNPDGKRIARIQDVVQAMKSEGIYTHLSIYFPLWLKPSANLPWLKGYNGETFPFAALFFNPDFQARYRDWWRAVLLTPQAGTGARLVDEPAVFGAELQNEDSFFFWTFNAANIPGPQLQILEAQFGSWLAVKYGTLGAAFHAWNSPPLPRDSLTENRATFRPLHAILADRSLRDRDTVAFLFACQSKFYRESREFLQTLGFKGLVTASNWTTANAEMLGPLEKASYTSGDFIDRHGYYASNLKGDSAEWSIRIGQTYSDRSALRFDGEEPGSSKMFVHPVNDIKYNHLPSMISETTWCRPNRHRGEAPLFLAAYGALQDSNALVHFAFDGSQWQVKPGYWMQPWTLMSPAMFGQFPAAALLFRAGLVAPGQEMADLELAMTDLLALKGTPLTQAAALDELRLRDVPTSAGAKQGGVIDPLIHYIGRTSIRFTEGPAKSRVDPLEPYLDRQRQQVSASHGQLVLDYAHGLLRLAAPSAQGVSGDLSSNPRHVLPDLAISSPLNPGHIVLVSLDGLELARSRRMLLQVMSEERTKDFAVEPVGGMLNRITNIGRDPWQYRALAGIVEFRRPDAASLQITALDHNGYKTTQVFNGPNLQLAEDRIYYLVETK
jgi:hypothetical protein